MSAYVLFNITVRKKRQNERPVEQVIAFSQ